MAVRFLLALVVVLSLGGSSEARRWFKRDDQGGFVGVEGTRFMLNGHPMFINGFNAYWLTYYAFDSDGRTLVTETFEDASHLGLNVARAWAFNEGSFHAIRSSPGVYDEQAFKGLDFVIAEAQRHGIKLILSLSNNYDSYGGKPKYIQWARNAGQSVQSEDDFFRHPVIKEYYKDYVKTVLTRVNSITGNAYKDDPTIFAWELMNEPRCLSDPSGDTLQAWIEEMSAFVKSIDSKHMVEIGLEGFYADAERNGAQLGGVWSGKLGTDFIRNNQLPNVDFTTMHCYPDLWLPNDSFDAQLSFLEQWIQRHVEDATVKLKKPVLFAEFGKSSRTPGYGVEQRDRLYEETYGAIFSSGGSGGAGALLWQLVPESLAGLLNDGFQVVPSLHASTLAVISKQSQTVSFMNSRSS